MNYEQSREKIGETRQNNCDINTHLAVFVVQQIVTSFSFRRSAHTTKNNKKVRKIFLMKIANDA